MSAGGPPSLPPLREVNKVSTRRRIFVGDVHGCLGELEDLAREVGFSRDDEVVLIGDLLNKGPESPGVLDWAHENGARTILGNHEWKFLSCLETDPEKRTERERGFLAPFGERAKVYAEWIATWPLWIEWPDVMTVHAGLEPGVTDLKDMRRKILLTIRNWDGKGEILDRVWDPAWYDVVRWHVPVVFGHWAARGLTDLPHCKGLDTGCVYGGRLTAWSPDENRFWHVPARREWVPFKD